mgnify:CR=1 FL=1
MKKDLLKQEVQGYLEPVVRDILKIKIGIIAVRTGCYVCATDILGPSSAAVGLNGITVAEPAARDLDAIVERLSQESPLDAHRFYHTLADAVLNVQISPELGVSGRHPETREIHLPEHSTTLVYGYGEKGAIMVFAILHDDENQL